MSNKRFCIQRFLSVKAEFLPFFNHFRGLEEILNLFNCGFVEYNYLEIFQFVLHEAELD